MRRINGQFDDADQDYRVEKLVALGPSGVWPTCEIVRMAEREEEVVA